MSKIFPNASKKNPCTVCGKEDWCSFGDRAMICRRIASDKPHFDRGGNLDGHYHFYDSSSKPTYIPPKRSSLKVFLGIEKLIGSYDENFHQDKWAEERLAIQLGVSIESIQSLKICHHQSAFGIPMRDGENKIIGIHLRFDSGVKKSVTGSRNGLFCPQGIEVPKVIYICEGASNTAALLTMGFYAIGRPSCNSGGEMLKVALKRLGVLRIVIVADNDTLKTAPDGRTFRPGQDGAKKLKNELGLRSVIFTPPNPLKDVRDLLKSLGVESARNYITNLVSQKIWAKV